jgi:alpha-L-fucosidase
MTIESLFEQTEEKLEKYRPRLIVVDFLGNPKGGSDNYGNEFRSYDINDHEQLPVDETVSKAEQKKLRKTLKRIIIVGKATARHYLDHENGDLKSDPPTIVIPMVKPEKRNQYWVREIYAEPTEETEE